MIFPVDHVDEVRSVFGNAKPFTEGASPLLLVTGIRPFTEKEDVCDIVLIAGPFEGYPSRLYYSKKLATPHQRNWNGERQFLERTWYAFSWNGIEVEGKRLITLIQQHLRGLSTP